MNTALTRPHRRRAVAIVTVALVIALVALILTVQQALPTASAAPLSPESPPVADSATLTHSATAADGLIGDARVTVFDDVPAVAGLDDALREALRRAARAAASDGIELRINSGWRSPGYQQQLLQEAVAKYGSAEEAARWVATADTSEHVTGAAVDIGPWRAADWLGRRGADFGLCRVYANEPWHFELRTDAATGGCPPMYADPTKRRR